ncbi:MAG: RDD family protein [Ignavibacteria bacterium]|nr:RDD family protein [Ignavibacteria bacterium]
MICEKCNNDYPSTYFFATPTICKSCYEKLSDEEKQRLSKITKLYTQEQTIELRANFGKRFLAALVDTLILVVIVIAFYKFTGFFDSYIEFFQELRNIGTDKEAISEFQENFFRANALNFAFPAILYLIYFLSEAFYGISLGKYLLGLKIASVDGKNAPQIVLWTRYLVKNSSSIMTLIWVISGLSLFNVLNSIFGLAIFFGFLLIFGRNKQNLQDIIAKTAVFKTEILEELNQDKTKEQTIQE